jgi:hypothetical protein
MASRHAQHASHRSDNNDPGLFTQVILTHGSFPDRMIKFAA